MWLFENKNRHEEHGKYIEFMNCKKNLQFYGENVLIWRLCQRMVNQENKTKKKEV